MTASDTIFALSSGLGRVGVAVVRVSGPMARQALVALCGTVPLPRRASLRTLRDPLSGEPLDSCLTLWLPGPGTATGEDMAEFHIHGSHAVLSGVTRALGREIGMRPAEAGEFTRRAVANGKMDLVEVEGLASLLSARSEGQRRQALHHMQGTASSRFEDWRRVLVSSLAYIEGAVDFSEEDSTTEAARRAVGPALEDLVQSMRSELMIAERAMELREGVRVVIAGRPNTGKSSLLNGLLRREAAIVSATPGTTRDVVGSSLIIGQYEVTLSDTAGLRPDTGDEIERIGIQRAEAEIGKADIVIWVWSRDVNGSAEIPSHIRPTLLVRNKIDLDDGAIDSDFTTIKKLEDFKLLALSSLTGFGLEELRTSLDNLIRTRYELAESAVIVRLRQKKAVEDALQFIVGALARRGRDIELVAEDLRQAATSLGRITGRIDVEDVLSVIFSEFCIGK